MNEIHKKLGNALRLERERQGTKLEDIAERLKISETSLRAIEEGDSSALPSEVYFGLFAKSYAESIGIDYGRTMEAIKDEQAEVDALADLERTQNKFRETADAETKVESRDDDSEVGRKTTRKFANLIIFVIVMFIVFVVASFLLFSGGDDPAEDNHDHPDAPPSPVQARQQEEKALGEYEWSAPEQASPDSLELLLQPRGESWSTIIADGDTALFRSLLPDRTYLVKAAHRLVVSIGVPSQVDVVLNGKSVDLRRDGSRRVSRVEINQANVKEFYEPPPDFGAAGFGQVTEPVGEVEPPASTETGDDPVTGQNHAGEESLHDTTSNGNGAVEQGRADETD